MAPDRLLCEIVKEAERLEVKLKDLIQLGTRLDFFEEETVQGILGDHNLAKLWTQVNRLLQDCWPNEDEGPLKGVETVINQFHQADATGQAFRYDHNKETLELHHHDKLPTHISMTQLRTAVDAVFGLLEASKDMMREGMSSMD